MEVTPLVFVLSCRSETILGIVWRLLTSMEMGEPLSLVCNCSMCGDGVVHGVPLVYSLAEVVVASPLHFLRADQPELGAVHVFSNVRHTRTPMLHAAHLAPMR